MADIRTSFAVLEDSATEVGLPLHKVQDGDAYAGKNALPALVAKDGSGNLHYLTTINGNLAVTLDSAGVRKFARGKVTGSQSLTTVAEIALTPGKVYSDLAWVVSCFRDAAYEIVAIDDPSGTPVEVSLADVLVGSGDLTDSGKLNVSFTAGATSPVLRVRAQNQNAVSDFRATISAIEAA